MFHSLLYLIPNSKIWWWTDIQVSIINDPHLLFIVHFLLFLLDRTPVGLEFIVGVFLFVCFLYFSSLRGLCEIMKTVARLLLLLLPLHYCTLADMVSACVVLFNISQIASSVLILKKNNKRVNMVALTCSQELLHRERRGTRNYRGDLYLTFQEFFMSEHLPLLQNFTFALYTYTVLYIIILIQWDCDIVFTNGLCM